MLEVKFITGKPEELNEPQYDKTNKMTCASSKNRSAWTSTHSDQSFCFPQEKAMGP